MSEGGIVYSIQPQSLTLSSTVLLHIGLTFLHCVHDYDTGQF